MNVPRRENGGGPGWRPDWLKLSGSSLSDATFPTVESQRKCEDGEALNFPILGIAGTMAYRGGGWYYL